MAGVGKDPVLFRQIGPAAIHQIQARQPVLGRDFLCANVFLHRFVVEGSTLYRGIIGDHHAGQPMDDADAGHDTRARHLIPILPVGRERRQFHERSSWIHQQVDPFTHQKLATFAVTLNHVGASARGSLCDPRAQHVNPFALRCVVADVGFRCGQHCCFKTCHDSDLPLFEHSVEKNVGIGRGQCINAAT